MEVLDVDKNQFISKVNKLFGSEDKFWVSIFGWQDGDYFKKLCEEDGGVITEHYQIFKNLPLNKKVNRRELEILIDRFQLIPFLTSKKGNYKFHYDLHVWSKNYYMVYNSHLGKLMVKKLNVLDKILSPAVQSPWQKETDSKSR